jgi:ceroid-lipofuscinosis MFS transporter 7
VPQGFWLGLLTTAGSLARVVGPIFVAFIYRSYGTWLTFGIISAVLFVAMLLTLVSYKRLVPKVTS